MESDSYAARRSGVSIHRCSRVLMPASKGGSPHCNHRNELRLVGVFIVAFRSIDRAGSGADCSLRGVMTFCAQDLEKFVASIDHADIVNGTRIVAQIHIYSTQLTTFMYYVNYRREVA